MSYRYTDNLRSPRLSTRFLTAEDIPTWATHFNDKEATEFYLPDDSPNEERARKWINWQLTRYRENRYGLQALIDKNSGTFIGQCGLLLQEVNGEKLIEVGYHIFRMHWGKGYAPEAAKLFIDYAFSNDITDSVVSIIDRGNVKSQRVAEKNGLFREKETNWLGMNVYIYRINKSLKTLSEIILIAPVAALYLLF